MYYHLSAKTGKKKIPSKHLQTLVLVQQPSWFHSGIKKRMFSSVNVNVNAEELRKLSEMILMQ